MRNCAICRCGTLEAGSEAVVLEREATGIFKDVPARVCDKCGEELVSAEVNASLLQRAEEAVPEGLEMLGFAA